MGGLALGPGETFAARRRIIVVNVLRRWVKVTVEFSVKNVSGGSMVSVRGWERGI